MQLHNRYVLHKLSFDRLNVIACGACGIYCIFNLLRLPINSNHYALDVARSCALDRALDLKQSSHATRERLYSGSKSIIYKYIMCVYNIYIYLYICVCTYMCIYAYNILTGLILRTGM